MLFMMSYNGLRRVLKLQCSGIIFFGVPTNLKIPHILDFLGIFLSVFRLFRVFSYVLGYVLEL